MPRKRKHHNNKGAAGIKNGSYEKKLKRFCKRSNIPFGVEKKEAEK